MREGEMAEIASLIGRALRHHADDAALAEILDAANTLCSKFRPYH
jgi:glycine/serine hydroxymethyltransferase